MLSQPLKPKLSRIALVRLGGSSLAIPVKYKTQHTAERRGSDDTISALFSW